MPLHQTHLTRGRLDNRRTIALDWDNRRLSMIDHRCGNVPIVAIRSRTSAAGVNIFETLLLKTLTVDTAH